ncbi:hypothetical protein BpHYR1_024132 [Brachionus plicatilis]|uniref:Uncharacterized protein n=1 Tax=Brachionus plicatilis TaxID=10195 RepID=A0A3M7TAB6_BRAPC|nr:hypothetical protein BpHYR1_024132 [Brachionus plicatilis]
MIFSHLFTIKKFSTKSMAPFNSIQIDLDAQRDIQSCEKEESLHNLLKKEEENLGQKMYQSQLDEAK